MPKLDIVMNPQVAARLAEMSKEEGKSKVEILRRVFKWREDRDVVMEGPGFKRIKWI